MPRRKTITVKVSELTYAEKIIEMLRNDSTFDGYDFSTTSISIKMEINPVIKNAKRALTFLEHYLAANPNCIEYFQDEAQTGKKQLARMMRISRTTLDKWLRDGLIHGKPSKYIPGVEYYDVREIISELKSHIK